MAFLVSSRPAHLKIVFSIILCVIIVPFFSRLKNVCNGAEAGVFLRLTPKTVASKEPAHILVVRDSVFVVGLIVGGENVV